MTSSDLLHKLIHSLSAAEKRYVKIFLRSEENKQVSQKLNTLFSAFSAQESYNETAIKKIIDDSTLRKNFALYKNLLHEKTMDALAAFSRGSSPEHRIYRRLENHKALLERGHLALAMRELEKARKEAEKHEHYFLLLEIQRRLRIGILTDFNSQSVAHLQNNISYSRQVFQLLGNEFEFSLLYDLSFAVGKEKGVWKLENNTTLRDIVANPLLANESSALTFEAKLKYHAVYSDYYKAEGNETGNVWHRKKIIEIWNRHPEKIKQLKWRYRVALGSLALAYHNMRCFHEFPELISQLETVAGKGKNFDPLAFRPLEIMRQVYYMNTAKFHKLSEHKMRLEKAINQYSQIIDTGFYMTVYYNMSVAELMQGNYAEALRWLKKITDMPKHSVRLDMQLFMPVYRLMILYSHNSPQLDYDLRNAQRFYAKQTPGTLESLVLKNIKALYLCNSRNEKQTLLNTFMRDMQQLLAQPDNSNIVGIDEVYCWVKALHENKPPLEVATPYLLGKNRSKQEVEKRLREFEKGMRKED